MMFPPRRSLKYLIRGTFAAIIITACASTGFAGIESLLPAKKQDVMSLCGTSHVKLVFRYYGVGLCYIDFSEAATDTSRPPIRVIPGTTAGTLPVISPDGQWVTYATGVNGDKSSNPSTAWLSRLSETATATVVKQDAGYVPRFAFNDGGTPTVVYATCSWATGSDNVWKTCGTVEKVLAPGGVPGIPTVLCSSGAYVGGLSYDGRYLATAENNTLSYILDLNASQAGPRYTPLLNDICDTIMVQTCNPSVSSSQIYTNAMSCLTTAGYHSSIGDWGFHDRIFVCDAIGRVLQCYQVPPEIVVVEDPSSTPNGEITKTEWDASEWSSHPYYMVAALKLGRVYYNWATEMPVNRTRSEMAYMINLKTSAHVKLIEVTDTSLLSQVTFPGLWVERATGFTEEPGWLEPFKYTPAFPDSCNPPVVCDTCACDTCTPTPPEPVKENRCGTGSGLAFIPPICFFVAAGASRRRKKLESGVVA